MSIVIKGAKENNLKNIDVKVPIGRIIGITGVSGSGKSTLAKDIIARYGYRSYATFLPKSTRDNILNEKLIDVEEVSGLPATLLIDVVNSVNNTKSTLSTITGMHYIIRKMYNECGEIKCKNCGNNIDNDIWKIINERKIELFLELKLDSKYKDRLKKLESIATVSKIKYFDEDGKETKAKSKQKYCYVYFFNNDYTDKELCNVVYKKMGLPVKTYIDEVNHPINLFEDIVCSKCKSIAKKKTMKRFSFNVNYEDGGGACRKCGGYGTVVSINRDRLIIDKEKSICNGAIQYLNKNGIKYTQISDKFIEAVALKYGFSLDLSISQLSKEQQDILFYGSEEVIKFSDKSGANGGKKEEVFKGIIAYLIESYNLGKGKKFLEDYVESKTCESCNGTRIDEEVLNIRIFNTSIIEVLKLSIIESYKLFEMWKQSTNDLVLKRYIIELQKRLNVFNDLGCGYLTLNRASVTLSGGELQRLRLATFISENIGFMCIILDEPSTGLHPADTKNIIKILEKLKMLGNTVIVVEHNKYVLEYCDFFVDLGPNGGEEGGRLLFADKVDNLSKYDTSTSRYLISTESGIDRKSREINKVIEISWDRIFNIKASKAQIPINVLVTICGVSGSGKSTFVNRVLVPYLREECVRGSLNNIEHLGQKSAMKTEVSNVGSLLEINQMIAKVFSNINKNIDKSSFLINSSKGKCTCCGGKGIVSSVNADSIDICPECEGRRFSLEVLNVSFNSYSIDDILNMTIDSLYEIFEDAKIKDVLKICIDAGIGYLSLNRTSKTLSKGEIQRIKLISVIKNKTKNSVLILDEPTRGLHHKDINRLLNILNRIIDQGNTVISIEHNIDFIFSSDYIIEFGPEPGINGGEIVFCGASYELKKATTATSKMLKEKKISNLSEYMLNRESKHVLEYKNIEYSINKNEINKMKLPEELINKLVTDSNSIYMNSILPVKNIALDEYDRENSITQAILPLILEIDFNKMKLPQNYTMLEVLNINSDIAFLYTKACNLIKNTNKFVFSYGNMLGKCKACRGKGIIECIDLDLIMENGLLNQASLNYIKKNTNYSISKKNLKKLYKIDIAKEFNTMTDEEKIVFVFGDRSKKFDEGGKEYCWEGLNKNILKYIKHYEPAENAVEIKNSVKTTKCKFCNGELLNPTYRDVKVFGYSFGEFVNSTLYDISEKIDGDKNVPIRLKKCIQQLIIFGFGNYNLLSNLSSFSEKEKAIIKLVTLYINEIYDAILIIKNIEILDIESRNKCIELCEKITNVNSIILQML